MWLKTQQSYECQLENLKSQVELDYKSYYISSRGKQLIKTIHLCKHTRKICLGSIPVESIIPCCSAVKRFRNSFYYNYNYLTPVQVLSTTIHSIYLYMYYITFTWVYIYICIVDIANKLNTIHILVGETWVIWTIRVIWNT